MTVLDRTRLIGRLPFQHVRDRPEPARLTELERSGTACRHLPLNRAVTAFVMPACCWTVLWRHWCTIRPDFIWMAPLAVVATRGLFLNDLLKMAGCWPLTVTLKPLLRRAS